MLLKLRLLLQPDATNTIMRQLMLGGRPIPQDDLLCFNHTHDRTGLLGESWIYCCIYMEYIVVATFVSLFSLLVSACHVADHVRERRQANSELQITNDVRKYFSRCLKEKVGDIWSWKSVVDYSILDTHWYENSDSSNCSRSIDLDTPDCWKERVQIYLRNSSFLVPPCHECIDQFGSDTSQGIRTYTLIDAVSLATANRYEICVEPDSDVPFRPNSPRVRRYSSCNSDNIQFLSGRTPLDFPSVFQFIEAHTICGSEFGECDSDNRAIIGQSNPDITRWPYRYEALTLDDSPLQAAIGLCNQRFFPPDVADWSQWSPCSVSCGSGQRSRGLNCDGVVCASTELQECNTQLCQLCAVSVYTRKRCIGFVANKQQCLDRGCCYDKGFCYRQGKPPSFIKFTPSVQPNIPFGGEPGFPGSNIIKCNRLLRGPRCVVLGQVDSIKCQRVGCCWDSQTGTCYRGSFRVTNVRQTCPPGFTNPPRCDDMNECTASPCMNGGTCHNQINGFLCDCPATASGLTCSTLSCLSPPSPTNGLFLPIKLFYGVGELVDYQCNGPYILDGDLTNACLSTGTWSNLAPLCKLACGTPPLNPNLQYTPVSSSYDVHEMVTYSCPIGYDLIGITTTSICSPSGWIINSVPVCNLLTAASCGTPPLSSMVIHSPMKTSYVGGESVNYICPSGFNLVGTTYNQCLASNWFFATSPDCVAGCTAPPTPVNGFYTSLIIPTPSLFNVGDSVTYGCNSPLVLSGEPTSNTCIGPATWQNTMLSRCASTCGGPPMVGLVTVSMLKTTYLDGERITYSCPTDYSLVGTTTNECLVTGWMFSTSPTCNPVCTSPPIPTNGFIISFPLPTEYQVGETIMYACNEPLTLVGDPSNRCDGPGSWQFTAAPMCSAVCGAPPSPVDGSYEPIQTTYIVGESVTYFCGVDIPLIGPSSNSCSAEGWTGTAPTCG